MHWCLQEQQLHCNGAVVPVDTHEVQVAKVAHADAGGVIDNADSSHAGSDGAYPHGFVDISYRTAVEEDAAERAADVERATIGKAAKKATKKKAAAVKVAAERAIAVEEAAAERAAAVEGYCKKGCKEGH